MCFSLESSSEMKRKEWSERLHQINLYFSKKWEFLLNLWRKSRITFDSFLKRKFFFCFVFENILSLLPEKSFQTQKRNIIVPTILFSLPLSQKKKKKTIRNQIILFFTQRRKYDIPWMSGSGVSSLLTVAKIGCFDVDLSCELMRCGGWFAQRSTVSLIHGIYIYIYIYYWFNSKNDWKWKKWIFWTKKSTKLLKKRRDQIEEFNALKEQK